MDDFLEPVLARAGASGALAGGSFGSTRHLGTSIWSGVFPGAGDQVLVQGLAEDLVTAAVEIGDLRSAPLDLV